MRKRLVIVISLVTVTVAVILLWPTAGYDVTQVHSSLRELAAPYQSVSTGFYLDGGSIGITIVDRTGQRLQLALPVSSDGGRSYPKLFIGATHRSRPGSTEVAFTEDTRRMLVTIVEQYRSPTGSDDITLVSLRGAPRDYARIWGHAVVSFCRRLVE